jgi:two-component system KDP operon response regulator KdpE
LPQTVSEESERLNRFIANLLDMTKLESGAVVPNAALHDVGEVVGSALERASKILAKHRVEVEISSDLPMVMVDAVLFEQVLFNLRSTMLPNMLLSILASSSKVGAIEKRSGCRSLTKERAFRLGTSSGSSISSIARGGAPGACWYRSGIGYLEGFYRSYAWTDGRRQSSSSRRRRLYNHSTDPSPGNTSGASGFIMSTTPAPKILVVDDEPPIRKLLRMGLSSQGYDVVEAADGKSALELLAKKPALVILDLGLPDIDGHDLLRRIRHRQENLPIIVLSSRGDEAGKVTALDLGADDYVTKPFGMDELLARMRAAMRHQLQEQGERPLFQVGDLSVDLVRRIVKVGDREIRLSPKEYDLLRLLVQHAGKVLTHRLLIQELWDEPTDPQYLRVYVRQLRRKIEADPERPQYVMTEMGVGYRLRAPD